MTAADIDDGDAWSSEVAAGGVAFVGPFDAHHRNRQPFHLRDCPIRRRPAGDPVGHVELESGAVRQSEQRDGHDVCPHVGSQVRDEKGQHIGAERVAHESDARRAPLALVVRNDPRQIGGRPIRIAWRPVVAQAAPADRGDAPLRQPRSHLPIEFGPAAIAGENHGHGVRPGGRRHAGHFDEREVADVRRLRGRGDFTGTPDVIVRSDRVKRRQIGRLPASGNAEAMSDVGQRVHVRARDGSNEGPDGVRAADLIDRSLQHDPRLLQMLCRVKVEARPRRATRDDEPVLLAWRPSDVQVGAEAEADGAGKGFGRCRCERRVGERGAGRITGEDWRPIGGEPR